MTDQTIPADEVREIIASYRGRRVRGGMILDALEALLPPPPRPTLADMTPEERSACRWMQCDHGIPGRSRSRGVIGYFDYEGEKAVILTTTCGVQRRDYAHVTPRPDLPRLEWPGDKEPKPAPAPIAPEDYPPRDQLALGAKWYDITKLEEALRQKGEAADQAIVLDDEGDAHVWETVGGGRWMVRVPLQQCGPFRLILNEKGADQ